MTCEELSNDVIDYLEGTLASDRRAALEAHAEGCDACREQMRTLRQTWGGLEELPQAEPSPRLRERFYAMLEAEQHSAVEQQPLRGLGAWFAGLEIRRLIGPASAAGLILVVGIVIGAQRGGLSSPPDGDVNSLRAEVRSLSQLVTLSLLQQDSASERLKGVRYGSVAAEHDDEVLSALIDAVGHDGSVSVRLAAIDALRPYLSRPTVSNSMLASLRSERSPLVQVSLVDLLMDTTGGETRDTLEALANDLTVDETVRAHVRTRLEESL